MSCSKINKYNEFEKLCCELKRCSDCPNLVESRIEVMGEEHQPVFPSGNVDAEIFIIGEAPGSSSKGLKNQIKTMPFAYSSGNILRSILKENNVEDKVFVSNLVKCNTPTIGIQESEFEHCIEKWLIREIELVKPKKIIVLGHNAKTQFNRFALHSLGKIEISYLFHPAYFLRNRDEVLFKNYKKVWESELNEE